MFDKNRWQIPEHDAKIVKLLSDSLRINPLCAKLLINRGYVDINEARSFIQKSDSFLHNPYLLQDVRKATARIRRALENEEKITIYGDYDVDGVTSVSILYMYLRDRGADVDYYIPTREHEGYGLNIGAFHTIKDNGTKVILSHYPTPFWNGQFRDSVHLYGHVHNTHQWNMMESWKKELQQLQDLPARIYNVGVMMDYIQYYPRTLDEILKGAKND